MAVPESGIAIVPAAHQAAVTGALTAAFGGAALESLALVHGGVSAALVYRAVVDGRPYLLRVATRIHALNDPARHHACLRIAAAAGLAPRLHHADDATAITISDFVTALPFGACPHDTLLDQLAGLMVRLRAAPRFPAAGDYLAKVDDMIADVRRAGMLPEQDAFARYAELSASYPREPDGHVSSHNDLNPGNVLWDGARLWLVDWETAFANDPYVDLAQAHYWFVRTPDHAARLTTAVLGGPPDAYQGARLWLMDHVVRMLFATMMLRMVHAQRPTLQISADDLAAVPPLAALRGREPELLFSPEGQQRYALSVLADLDARMRSPRFSEALALVRR
jgi:hypothetical protein